MQQLYNITSQLNNQGKPSFCSLLLLPITITGSHLHASPFLLFSSSHSTVCVCVCVSDMQTFADWISQKAQEQAKVRQRDRQTNGQLNRQTDKQTEYRCHTYSILMRLLAERSIAVLRCVVTLVQTYLDTPTTSHLSVSS